jgi:ligand-binding sensor domain-containing protein
MQTHGAIEGTLGRRLCIAVVAVCSLIAGKALALDPHRAIAEFQHTAWTSANGVPSGVWCITQSPDGYLWLGTGLGLYIFDGVTFEKFRSVDGSELQGIDVTALSESPSGTIWVGFQSGGVSSIRNGKVTNYAPGRGLPSGFILNLAVADDGVVWATGSAALARFDGSRWQTIDQSWSLPAGGKTFLKLAGDGTLWVKLAGDGGVFYLKPDTHQFIRTDILFSTQSGFALDGSGRLWTVDRNDLLHELPSFAAIKKPRPDEPSRGTSSLMMFDSDGTMWGSTRTALNRWPAMTDIKGIYRRRSPKDREPLKSTTGDFDSFQARDGLSSGVVAAIFEDREGNIWTGTNLGLDRFSPANIVSDRSIPLTSASGYLSVLTRDGLYFTGDSALYRVQAGGSPKIVASTFITRPGLFLADKDGAIWSNDLFGNNGTISRWKGSAANRISLPADPYDYDAGGFSDDGTLWVSNEQLGVARLDGNRWVRVLPPPENSSEIIDTIQSDKHGGMWLSNYSDQTVFHADSKSAHEIKSGAFRIGGIQVIYPYSGGTLFGGDYGIVRFDGRDFRAILSRDVEPLTLVSGIVESPDKHVYINTGVGIVRVETAELDRAFDQPSLKLNYELLDSDDGLRGVAQQNCNCNTATLGPDSRLWFITGNGIAWIDAAHLHRNKLAPPVYIRAISNGSTRFPTHPDLQLPPGSANLRFDYTALSFTDPDRMHFRYKLDGVDPDWVDAGTRRQAFYTRLSPGIYHFHVIASNNDGVWNRTGATQTFTIPPTFLQSNFFVVLCVLGGVLVLWALYQLRVTQLAAHYRGRLLERLSERERIARELHDTLLQGVQGLILRFQSAADQIAPGTPPRLAVEGALERAETVLLEGRDRVKHLRLTDRDANLPALFAETGKELARGGDVDFSTSTAGTVLELHPIVRDEVASIGNEALTNAFHHAHAKNIVLAMNYGRARFTLSVRDDGRGIDAKTLASGAREGHFGLQGMRERAQKIGAEISLSSREGQGTEITLNVPGHIAYASVRASGFRNMFRRFSIDDE